WRKPLWQRTVVLAAGSATHFVLGFLVLWILVSFVGIANPERAEAYERSQETSTVDVAECLPPEDATADFTCSAADEPSPAHQAGMRDGGRVASGVGASVTDWDSLLGAVGALAPEEPAEVTVERDGVLHDLQVTPYAAEVVLEDGRSEERRVGKECRARRAVCN